MNFYGFCECGKLCCGDGPIHPKCECGKKVQCVSAVKLIMELHARAKELRLQRDILALNRHKGAPVYIALMPDGDVGAVTWLVNRTGSDAPLYMPKWYTAAESLAARGAGR